MRIKNYTQFIKEEVNDTPESYISVCLSKLKRKIDKMFEYQEGDDPEEDIKQKSIQQAKLDSKDKSTFTFKDLGVKLESSEISKYSKMYDSLTVKFTDENATYNLFIAIDLKEALPKKDEESGEDEDFSDEDIKKCFVKFKKYDLDKFNIIGQITKNVKISDIDEDFLINLKIELDEKFSDDDNEFKIETLENFNFFKKTSSYISNLKIHSICKKYKIKNYTINSDGSIDVDGNVNISSKGLTKIPLKFREVRGYFNCGDNELTSLEGCPERVGRSFSCDNNKLTTLEFSPKRVDDYFYCRYNDIWTFEDFNISIGDNFNCWNNPIWEIWRLFSNTEKFDLLNEIDAIRPDRVIILDRLNEFLIMIGKEPVKKVFGYTCI